MNSHRLNALDGWRGISISLVLAGHLLPLGPKAWNLNVAVAGCGMAIFFTLSGFLITNVLLRDDDVPNFLVRRLARIVPLAWLGALVALTATRAPLADYLPHLLFYANTGPMWLTPITGHYWSLCVEVQFYAGIALLVAAFGRRALPVLPLLALAVTALRVSQHELMVINTQYRIDEILAGCTLALVFDRLRAAPAAPRLGALAWLGLPLLVLCAHPAGGALNYVRPYVASTMVGLSLFAAPRSRTAALLSAAPLAYLAKISYAVYIIHGCLMETWLNQGGTVARYAKRPLFFAVLWGLAHLSTEHYESRFIAWGKAWTQARDRRRGRGSARHDAATRIDAPIEGAGAGEAEGRPLGILIVCEHASTRFGGEAALAFHYFRVMRARGLDVRLLTHARVRDELLERFPDDRDRLLFVEDTALQKLLWRIGRRVPARVSSFSFGFLSRVITQVQQRAVARRLVAESGVRVVHQPMPVSPREPSLLAGLGAPVVIGPLNGNMEFPPAFRRRDGALVGLLERCARGFTGVMNTLFPGKREAAAVLVANERTGRGLPGGLTGRVLQIVENGVDMTLWGAQPAAEPPEPAERPARFIYMGRLVDWKAVDLLLHAFERARRAAPMTLTLVGDGPERPALQALAQQLGLRDDGPGAPGSLHFAGWRSQADCAAELQRSDVLVLPSLWECGGAVVLEAMACRKPVIATAWGGPLDYLDEHCGILVPPDSREALIQGFADAMVALAGQPERRRAMGDAARARIEAGFDWERKVDRVLDIYREVVARASGAATLPNRSHT
jgi:peptidoglycan/LPS O-acetylase OafA/YrhL/glycosyltransferase involved in cell wall biosynthesis